VKIIKDQDFDYANELLEVSLITMDIQTKARKLAGIEFTADQ